MACQLAGRSLELYTERQPCDKVFLVTSCRQITPFLLSSWLSSSSRAFVYGLFLSTNACDSSTGTTNYLLTRGSSRTISVQFSRRVFFDLGSAGICRDLQYCKERAGLLHLQKDSLSSPPARPPIANPGVALSFKSCIAPAQYNFDIYLWQAGLECLDKGEFDSP